MSKWKFRKPEPPTICGPCVRCKERPQRPRYNGRYKPLCRVCDRELYGDGVKKNVPRPYRKYVKDHCEACGFVPEDICQLDVDHVDNNHSNNDPNNLQTLCANCHRLKTKKARRD